ncbi:MAG: Sir2 family NAD-dependent protein deacetylase [Microthrixaceae bacterium]|nr:Sir2 family NAD-dependent protein deacetylase [Microthrixaceae bacterium]
MCAARDPSEAARELLCGSARIAVLTGAGISTDAGIPDFRGPDGLWTRNPGAERASTIDNYLRDAEARRAAWRMRLDSRLLDARPTAGHRALVDLERQGRLQHLVTQNIDGLHRLAGTSSGRLTEVHGSVAGYVCVSCGAGGPIDAVVERVRGGEDDPRCDHCAGILKTTVVMFGEMLPKARWSRHGMRSQRGRVPGDRYDPGGLAGEQHGVLGTGTPHPGDRGEPRGPLLRTRSPPPRSMPRSARCSPICCAGEPAGSPGELSGVRRESAPHTGQFGVGFGCGGSVVGVGAVRQVCVSCRSSPFGNVDQVGRVYSRG